MASPASRNHAFSFLTDANYLAIMSDKPLTHAARFLRTQHKDLPYPATDFTGKTAIVTGANVGLGLEAARHFTRLGAAKVVLACRSVEKGEAARADIEASTGRQGVVEVMQVDLLSFESVKEFCARAARLDRVDVLLENASIAKGYFEENEGFESTITVNVLSTFLMAFLLLPTLRRTAAQHNVVTRLSIVSSDAHLFARFKEKHHANVFDAFKTGDNMSQDRYNVSKLLQILLARQLAEEVGPPGPVIVNTINPSLCKTTLFRYAPSILMFIVSIFLFFLGRTAEMGSRTLMAAAFGGEDTHGKYLDSCEIYDPSRYVLSEEGRKMRQKLMGELLDILEGVQPGISGSLRA